MPQEDVSHLLVDDYRALAEANARGQPQRELTRLYTTTLDPLYFHDSG